MTHDGQGAKTYYTVRSLHCHVQRNGVLVHDGTHHFRNVSFADHLSPTERPSPARVTQRDTKVNRLSYSWVIQLPYERRSYYQGVSVSDTTVRPALKLLVANRSRTLAVRCDPIQLTRPPASVLDDPTKVSRTNFSQNLITKSLWWRQRLSMLYTLVKEMCSVRGNGGRWQS